METWSGIEQLNDDLYARVWERDYERPVFDSESNNVTLPISSEITVRYDLSTEETCISPGTSRGRSAGIFPQTEKWYDVTDTYPYMEINAETSLE